MFIMALFYLNYAWPQYGLPRPTILCMLNEPFTIFSHPTGMNYIRFLEDYVKNGKGIAIALAVQEILYCRQQGDRLTSCCPGM